MYVIKTLKKLIRLKIIALIMCTLVIGCFGDSGKSSTRTSSSTEVIIGETDNNLAEKSFMPENWGTTALFNGSNHYSNIKHGVDRVS